ncbi:MAG: HAMP domain-containing sensor histidine kinase, partial [Flavobacterium sp.]|uniref:sensor histidine kinase n=1 Tax=Flavobacterium sp. TaxID=239 RepID=UPI0026284B56
MNLSLTKRKIIHILLFLSIVLIQILVYKTWNKEESAQNNFSKEIKNSIKPNKALEYNNCAVKQYFEAENYFNKYLQKHNKKDYFGYQNSLKMMMTYLDSLDLLSKSDKPFKMILKSKQKTENNIIFLRKELDSLIGISLSDQNKIVDFQIKKIDFDKVLSSISYDTIKKETSSKKKGFFGRIKDAISNESNVNSLFTEVQIKMIYNNEPKTGNFEEQLKNVFLYSKEQYQKQILNIAKVYGNLKERNDFLLIINQEILNRSQNILFYYSKATQELTKKRNETALKLYNIDISNRKRTLLYLLLTMGLVTVLLFLYTIYAYIHEKYLAKAKTDAERNLDTKNRLIGMLSHEMRAPLSVISNFSNKLKLENTDLSIASTINSIHFASNSLRITVNQILDFFKNENSKIKLYNSQINLNQEVYSVLESLKSIAEAKDITIVSELDSSLDTLVWADVVKMHQLFYNFIGNSIKFTKEGLITVTAKLTKVGNSLR